MAKKINLSRFAVAITLCWTPVFVASAGSADTAQSRLAAPQRPVTASVVLSADKPVANNRILLAARQSENAGEARSSSDKRSRKRDSLGFPHDTVLGGYASFLDAIGLPPPTLWKVLQQSNLMLEAIARSEALPTGHKRYLAMKLQMLRLERPGKFVIDGLEKVLGDLTSTEQYEALLVMLNEPNIKSALLQLPIDEVRQSNAPLDPNKLSVFAMEQPDGEDYLAAMGSEAGLPGAAGSRSGSGGGAGKRKQGNKGSGASLKDMIDCLDVLHPQGGQTIGGDGTGPDPSPIGTTVDPDSGWTAGSKGQPKKKASSKGIGFGEAGQCYGLDLSKLSNWASDEDKTNKENTEANKENQKGEKDEVVTQPSHYSWSVEYEYKYKGELYTGRETFEGIVGWSTDEKTWNLVAEFQAELSFKGETEGYTEELTITGTQDEIKQEVEERFLNSLVEAVLRNEGKITNVSHNKLYDPDALDQEPCDNTDYEAFAACIGGSGAAPEDCKGKGKYPSGGIALPSGEWLGCPSNKAMAIGLLPIHKLWDPTPLEKVVQLRLQMLSQPGEMLPGQNQGLIDNAESQKVQKSTD
jgi:hypothetical protein